MKFSKKNENQTKFSETNQIKCKPDYLHLTEEPDVTLTKKKTGRKMCFFCFFFFIKPFINLLRRVLSETLKNLRHHR